MRRDNGLLAELHVAKELHLTLGELRAKMTPEELVIWLGYFTMLGEDREKAMQKAQRRR